MSAADKFHVEASLGGNTDAVDVWIIWAGVQILTKGNRPGNAAPFDKATRDGSDKLGPVIYKSLSSSVIDEEAGIFVENMGASGKIAAVATIQPKGIHKVIPFGWTFERQVWTRNWIDGSEADSTTKAWARDTSKPPYLKLKPDSDDRIYDIDAPDIRWGEHSYESYNNFRQWIEWNGQKCSDYGLWYWRARWNVHRDPDKQITLNDVGTGNITLPVRPHLPPRRQR